MTSVVPTCRDCNRPRKPDELFCECGAFYDYTVTTVEQRSDGEPKGKAVAATTVEEFEWQPAQYERTFEPTATPRCRSASCAAGIAMNSTPRHSSSAGTARSLWSRATRRATLEPRRFLRLEGPPLPAGERAKDARSRLSTGLIVAAVLLLASVLLIGAIKAWGPASAGATHGYGVAREALFPRYNPVNPSSVNPPRVQKVEEAGQDPAPPADAFDSKLSTYWLSRTPRHKPDLIRVTFNPPAHHIEEVVVFAGDPTATTIVPAELQMTFYRWDPNPARQSDCDQHNRGSFACGCDGALTASSTSPDRSSSRTRRRHSASRPGSSRTWRWS